VELARLEETVARLKERLQAATPARNTDALLQQLTEQLARLQDREPAEPLRWIRAQVGHTLRLIATDDIVFLRADSKYTLIAWRGDKGEAAEALVRTPLKELASQLDPAQFVQVHRSAIVNLRAIDHVRRGDNETADIYLKGRPEVLPVSRNYLHHFKQM
jgi:DNA-binding LytR/AlgR family response regulator